jgi:hypothetical protein
MIAAVIVVVLLAIAWPTHRLHKRRRHRHAPDRAGHRHAAHRAAHLRPIEAQPATAPAVTPTHALDHAEIEEHPHPAVLASHLDRPLWIRYRDAAGALTERTVTLRRITAIDPPQPSGFDAVCHVRHRIRSFQVARTAVAADPTTGEIIPDLVEWLLAAIASADHSPNPASSSISSPKRPRRRSPAS